MDKRLLRQGGFVEHSRVTGGESERTAAAMPAVGSRLPSTGAVAAGEFSPEKFYVAAVESSIHAFITVDFDGMITSWSPGAEGMFDYPAQEAVGRHIDLIVPAGDDARIASFRDRIQQGCRVDSYEAVRIAKGGRKVNVVVTLSPIKAPSGDVVGVCSIVSDVTIQKQAEQLFRTMVEACPGSMIVSDEEGRIVLINSATERLFGYARRELLGESIDMLLPERARDPHARLRGEFMRCPDGGRAGHGRVLEARCKDGTEIAVEVGLSPIALEGRKMVLSFVSDVSDRLRVERIKNEFIATVSHELRTPLTSIAGSLGLLLGGAAGPQPAPVARLLTIAHSNSQRLVRLINDMLDIEKLEAGQVAFDFRETDVRPLVEQAIESSRGFADQFDVRLRYEPANFACIANVDADRIIQVVTNLLSNACKFSPAGGEVEVRIERHDAIVRVSVRDHGPGIPQEFRSRLFGKFAQAEGSATRHKGGTGLGLNIVRQLVTQHGGKVGFDAAPGGGTSFFVDLPAAASSPEPATAAFPRRRALICSGDLDLSSALCSPIQSLCLPVDVVPTGTAALAHAAAARYELFVIDLPVGDMDGVGLIRQLRAAPQHAQTPIIVVAPIPPSCIADLRYDDLGIVAWLEKPVDHARFADVLDRVKTGRGPPRILHVEDDATMRELVAFRLRREFEVVQATTLEEAHEALRRGGFDASLLDLGLPDGRGDALLQDLRDGPVGDLPLVVHSGHDVDPAVSTRAGAVVAKSQSINEVGAALRRLIGCGARGRPERGNA